MQSATWLRIAAGLTAFQAAGHTFGAVLAGPSSAEESALRATMGAFRVSLMGMERSYWDFYLGSGWAITALAVTVAAVMWLLAPIARAVTERRTPDDSGARSRLRCDHRHQRALLRHGAHRDRGRRSPCVSGWQPS